jgi:hypothetical protein
MASTGFLFVFTRYVAYLLLKMLPLFILVDQEDLKLTGEAHLICNIPIPIALSVTSPEE